LQLSVSRMQQSGQGKAWFYVEQPQVGWLFASFQADARAKVGSGRLPPSGNITNFSFLVRTYSMGSAEFVFYATKCPDVCSRFKLVFLKTGQNAYKHQDFMQQLQFKS